MDINIGDIVNANPIDIRGSVEIKNAEVIAIDLNNVISNGVAINYYLLTAKNLPPVCWTLCIPYIDWYEEKSIKVILNIKSYIGHKCCWVKENEILKISNNTILVKTGYTCKKCNELYPYAQSNQTDGSLICHYCQLWTKQ